MPNVTCECGCGQPAPIVTKTSARQQRIKGQPSRFISGHNSRVRSPGYTVDAVTGCWNWNGHKNPLGYVTGARSINGVTRQALMHRFFYEAKYGSIPSGLVLDHLCRNRSCVNPAHLEAVTQQVNIQRGHAARGSHNAKH